MKVQDWIDEWVALYPKNIYWNGHPLRTPAKYCVNKMQKLCKNNPNYTKDIIFAATKLYLKEREAKNWEYTKQATYFISKIG